jgi:hypothetical protein
MSLPWTAEQLVWVSQLPRNVQSSFFACVSRHLLTGGTVVLNGAILASKNRNGTGRHEDVTHRACHMIPENIAKILLHAT